MTEPGDRELGSSAGSRSIRTRRLAKEVFIMVPTGERIEAHVKSRPAGSRRRVVRGGTSRGSPI